MLRGSNNFICKHASTPYDPSVKLFNNTRDGVSLTNRICEHH